MNVFDFEIDEDFYEFMDYIFLRDRISKRYAHNLLERWNEIEFKKDIDLIKIISFILPLIDEALHKNSQRGLPILPLLQVLLTLLCNRKFSSKKTFLLYE